MTPPPPPPPPLKETDQIFIPENINFSWKIPKKLKFKILTPPQMDRAYVCVENIIVSSPPPSPRALASLGFCTD